MITIFIYFSIEAVENSPTDNFCNHLPCTSSYSLRERKCPNVEIDIEGEKAKNLIKNTKIVENVLLQVDETVPNNSYEISVKGNIGKSASDSFPLFDNTLALQDIVPQLNSENNKKLKEKKSWSII